jgi:hypothetical protein
MRLAILILLVFLSKTAFGQKYGTGYDILKVLGEKSLSELQKDPDIHMYRFIDEESFFPASMIKLEIKENGEGVLKYVRFTHAGNDTTRVVYSPLSKEKVGAFITLTKLKQFWDIPTSGGRMVEDGSTWTLDGVKKGKIHSIQRQSPRKDSSTAELCQHLQKLIENIKK